MTFTKLIVVLAFLATGALVVHEPKVTQVLSKDLTDIPGKEGLMLALEYPRAVRIPSIATMHMRLSMCWKAPL